ncbi:MAG: hypothetical protein HY298_20125 [Verrucomicrobia bacterium]|nr:hypothetical protein [Verrucomicrobiota bacterium]
MKLRRRRLPIPQHEFGFAPEAFNLFAESSLDGERITREQAEAEQRRRTADATQAALFNQPSTRNPP